MERLTKNYESIIVFGRGVAKHAKSGKWHPTPYFEVPIKGQHSGIYETNIKGSTKDAVVAGANCNVLAAYYVYQGLQKNERPPSLVIFAAGRPPFLENEPLEISEGAVLRTKFVRRITSLGIDTLPQMPVLAENKDTKDDLEKSLELLGEGGVKSVVVISIGIHLDRTKELFKMFRAKGLLSPDLEVDFLASDKILSGVDQRYRKKFRFLKWTPAYRRTLVSERRKLRMLKEEGYKFTEKIIE